MNLQPLSVDPEDKLTTTWAWAKRVRRLIWKSGFEVHPVDPVEGKRPILGMGANILAIGIKTKR